MIVSCLFVFMLVIYEETLMWWWPTRCSATDKRSVERTSLKVISVRNGTILFIQKRDIFMYWPRLRNSIWMMEFWASIWRWYFMHIISFKSIWCTLLAMFMYWIWLLYCQNQMSSQEIGSERDISLDEIWEKVGSQCWPLIYTCLLLILHPMLAC